MRIDSGSIGMDSARNYESTEFMVNRFSVTKTKGTLGDSVFSDLLNAGENCEDSEEEAPVASLDELKEKITQKAPRTIAKSDDYREQMRHLKEECINLLLRLLFPDIVDHFQKGETMGTLGSTSYALSDVVTPVNVTSLSYQRQYYYEENETTSFSAKGIVNCADGRSIDINIDLTMSRSFSQFYAEEISFVESSFTDPLVINFGGDPAAVSDQTFYFDIDSDGVEDEISRLIEGSGFLALDLNEDGIINDGAELFGSASGDGFKDLSAYDTDHDGWIDEDDQIFDKLKIWADDGNGKMQLYSLSEKGIGAICLSNAPTGFYLNSLEDNTQNARVRSTGVFLYENGGSGTVQQLDFARRARAAAAYA
ncbi:MAG: hypothetical protein K6A38_10475 [Lachnospiraceae bacterium]|nr:hypothetical protein [Lachnospiraceae bacterium]